MDSSSYNNFDLRPPLPLDHPYPASISSGSTSDGDHHAPGGCPALQEDDGYSAALSPNAKCTLQSILCRMYASAEVMELGSETRFTALVLFQRYYFASNVGVHFLPQQQLPEDQQQGSGSGSGASMPEKWREHLGTVAAACLFLGCKVEEEHRRIRDVINLSHMMDFAGARHANGSSTKGDGQCTSSNGKIHVHIHEADSPPDLDDEYWKTKERIVATEQEVLRMLRFDTSVSHPHRAVLLILDGLGINVMVVHDEGQSLVKESFTTLNDALFYPPALRHNVLPLACGAIQWAANHIFAEDAEEDKTGNQAGDSASAGTATTGSVAGASLPPGPWWRRFGVSDGEIEGVYKSLKRARK